MRKSFYYACILAFALSVGKAHAQTGIGINDNNATADQSAMLDVSVSAAAKKGFLLPRMTSTQRDAISSPAKGLLIYVTTVDSLEINIGTPATPKWFAFGNGSSTISGWQLKGNTGTNIATDFVGTGDNVDLAFRTNNFERLRISNIGNVGIGNTAPTQKLDVTGNVRFSGALMPNNDPGTAGYFLVSAGPGLAPVWFNAGGFAWLLDGNTLVADKKFGTTSNNNLPFITNNVERMRITSTGFVGIGTTTPTNTLQVSAASNPLALSGVQSSVSTDSLLTIDPATGVLRRMAMSRLPNWSYNGDAVTATTNLGTTTNFDLPFIANNTEWMRLTKTGNLGIGTTAPANKLTVVGTNPLALYGVQVGTTTNNDSVLVISNGIVKKVLATNFATSTNSNDWSLKGNAGTSAGTNFLGTTDDVALMFKVNNTEAGFIGNSGTGYSIEFGSGTSVPKWSGSYGVAIGGAANANNAGATSVGGKTFSAGNGTAVGYNAYTTQDGVAIGANSTSNGNEGVSIGTSSISNFQSVAIGKLASSSQAGVAIGYNSKASGYQSMAVGFNSTASYQNAMACGNLASGTGYLSVAVGYSTLASGTNSTAIGTNATASGINSTALGVNTTVSNDNTVVIGNKTTAVLMNDAAYDNTRALVVGSKNTNGNGAYLTTGGVWTNASDRNLKESFSKVSGTDVLAKIMALDVTKWKYKGTNEFHIGPMAQDFFAAFSLGTDDKHISSLDPSGVALVAIQELKKENDELTKRVDEQQKLLEQLLKEVNELKQK